MTEQEQSATRRIAKIVIAAWIDIAEKACKVAIALVLSILILGSAIAFVLGPPLGAAGLLLQQKPLMEVWDLVIIAAVWFVWLAVGVYPAFRVLEEYTEMEEENV